MLTKLRRHRLVVRGFLFLGLLLPLATLFGVVFNADPAQAQAARDGFKWQCEIETIIGERFWLDSPTPDRASCSTSPGFTGNIEEVTVDTPSTRPSTSDPGPDGGGSGDGSGGGSGGDGSTEPPPEEEPSCEANIPGIGWILCEVVEKLVIFLEDVVGGQLIKSILEYDAITDPANEDGFISVWAGFRTLANVGFVIAFMVVIYAAASGNALSAYDVKRLLPRLLIGAIMVQLSFFICRELVEFFNALGSGITELMLSPLGENAYSDLVPDEYSRAAAESGESNLLLYAEELATVLTVILLIVAMLFALGGVITVIVVFMLRNIILTILIVLSPIAFVTWILPNTENLFKRWFKFFINNLALFPVAMAFFASGRLLRGIWVGTDGVGDSFGDLWIGVFMVFLPWVMASQLGKITNRLTGGAVAAVQSGFQRARESGSAAGKAVGGDRALTKARGGDYGKTASMVTNPGAYMGLKGGRTRRQARARRAAERLESEETADANISLQTKRAEDRTKAYKKAYAQEYDDEVKRQKANGVTDAKVIHKEADEAGAKAGAEAADNAEVKLLTGIVDSDRSSAAEVRGASKALLEVHSNRADAVKSVSDRVTKLRSSGKVGDARLADRVVNDNLGSASAIPQLYKPNNRGTVEGLDANQLHNLKSGSLDHFTGREDASRAGEQESVKTTHYIAERYEADLNSATDRSKVKQASAQKLYKALQEHDAVTGGNRAGQFKQKVDDQKALGNIPWTVK